jgi:hypothetical protein
MVLHTRHIHIHGIRGGMLQTVCPMPVLGIGPGKNEKQGTGKRENNVFHARNFQNRMFKRFFKA